MLAAACLLIVAAVGFWYVRPRQHAIPTVDSSSVPVGTGTGTDIVTNSSVLAEPETSGLASTTTESTTPLIGPISTLSEEAQAQRQHRDGSLSLGQLSGLPILATTTDDEILATIEGSTLAASVSGGVLCVRTVEEAPDKGVGHICLGDPGIAFLAGRLPGVDELAIQVVVLPSAVSVTSVEGSCDFVLAAADEANGFNVWACLTPLNATVELDVRVADGPTQMAYIDGGVP